MQAGLMQIGVDLGGTKTEIAVLDGPMERLRRRIATPRDYDSTIAAITALVARTGVAAHVPLGVAIPGTETAAGTIKNANSTWLNGRPLRADLEAALGRPVRLANDANCFALSEAMDGAGIGARVVFGVIAGTGVGGGIVVDSTVIGGAHGVGGEWGHNPLPAMTPEEWAQAPDCYCGRRGCIEVWCSGPGLAADFARITGRASSAGDITASDDAVARATVTRFIDRFARALASVVNILDPDIIVLGGGLSNIARLYDELPLLVERHAFTLGARPRIMKNRHGDSSGVRGAAWLWPV